MSFKLLSIITFLIIFFTFSSSFTSAYSIENYGVNDNVVKSGISFINPAYFEGVKYITFIHSNPLYRQVNGYYYYGSNSIVIYDYNNDVKQITDDLKHELKHHYCWYNKHEITNEHKGCFLNIQIK